VDAGPKDYREFNSALGWQSSGQSFGGDDNWCQSSSPSGGWSLKDSSSSGSPQAVKVLSYNLYWWRLFGQLGGGGAGRLVADHAPYDFMGFQECDDVVRVLGDASLRGEYGTIQGAHALGMAYRKSHWSVLAAGDDDVAEDRQDQYYGKRSIQWARFQNMDTKKTVSFFNHHGPLPVGTGGRCGRHATAYNILHSIAVRTQAGDGIILVGDFNSPLGNKEINTLESYFHRVYSGHLMGGIDHVFSNAAGVVGTENLGGGGSDHDALTVTLSL